MKRSAIKRRGVFLWILSLMVVLSMICGSLMSMCSRSAPAPQPTPGALRLGLPPSPALHALRTTHPPMVQPSPDADNSQAT